MFFHRKSCSGFALQWPGKSGEASSDAKPREKVDDRIKSELSCETAWRWQLHPRQHIWNAQTGPLCPFSGDITFSQEKKTWLLNGGHKRVWVKRWVLKRRNISVTLSPITPPHCGHISSLMLLTIISICTIVMIITAVVIWWSPGPSDHGQSHKSKRKKINAIVRSCSNDAVRMFLTCHFTFPRMPF